MLLAGLALGACYDDGVEIVVRTVPATTPVAADTGIEQLDFTLDAAVRGDLVELAGLTGYQRVPCAREAAPSGPPACRVDEAAGTEVEVLPVDPGCAPEWARPEAVVNAYGDALSLRRDVIAVYRPRAPVYGEEYVAVYRTIGATREGDGVPGVALSVREGRVVAVEVDCGTVEELYADERVVEFIVGPREELLGR